VPVYRYYNPQTHLHYWSVDNLTPEQLLSGGTGYQQEAGIVFYVANPTIPGLHPVYRFYNPKTYLHLWVPDPTQANIDYLKNNAGFSVQEGFAFMS
jgi:hypothetical protein